MDLPLGVVLGTFGVERNAFKFLGQAAHSGSTPMHKRRDAFLAAGKWVKKFTTSRNVTAGFALLAVASLNLAS